jgi:hypothetical protein
VPQRISEERKKIITTKAHFTARLKTQSQRQNSPAEKTLDQQKRKERQWKLVQ